MPIHDNRLIAGDNLSVLRTLTADLSVAKQVKLVYIDPPYATGFDFQSATVGMAYSDQSRGATYLEALRCRLLLLHKLMSDDGSIYLHMERLSRYAKPKCTRHGIPDRKKNIEMLRMIIEASSNPDELALDAYAGSGTTLTAAGSLGRRWIGIDSSPAAISVSCDRLRNGTPRMGSYARKTYIKRAAGEKFPDADLSFGLWIDSENQLFTARFAHLP